MKSLWLVLCLAVAAALPAHAQTDAAHIKAEAQKCAQLLLAHDYDHFVAYVPPRVLKEMGGKETMAALIRKGLSGEGESKISLQDAQIGDPEKVQQMGSLQTVLIPQKLVLKVPGGKVEANSHLLGISEDQGKTWTFIDVSSVTEEQLATLFPEFKGQLHFPAKQPPVFTKE